MTSAESWIDQAFEMLRKRGYKTGAARSAVIEVVGREGGCMEPYQVVEQVRDSGHRVGTASVYRALNLLSSLGFLRRAPLGDGGARYELVHADGDHHHHLVCERCGETAPFDDRKIEQAIDDLENRVDYTVSGHELTLRGTCAKCRELAS